MRGCDCEIVSQKRKEKEKEEKSCFWVTQQKVAGCPIIEIGGGRLGTLV
jgi:hypothetical protein